MLTLAFYVLMKLVNALKVYTYKIIDYWYAYFSIPNKAKQS